MQAEVTWQSLLQGNLKCWKHGHTELGFVRVAMKTQPKIMETLYLLVEPISTQVLTKEALLVSNTNRQVLETSSQHARWPWFLLRLYQGAGLCRKQKRVYPNLFSPSTPTVQEENGGGGYGGLSVLEESHVVSESGQLLLIWNQWDWGRIWEQRGERHRGEVESEGDSSLCQMHSICPAPQLTAHVFWFQVNPWHLTSRLPLNV